MTAYSKNYTEGQSLRLYIRSHILNLPYTDIFRGGRKSRINSGHIGIQVKFLVH